jgi:hypothetical protein
MPDVRVVRPNENGDPDIGRIRTVLIDGELVTLKLLACVKGLREFNPASV